MGWGWGKRFKLRWSKEGKYLVPAILLNLTQVRGFMRCKAWTYCTCRCCLVPHALLWLHVAHSNVRVLPSPSLFLVLPGWVCSICMSAPITQRHRVGGLHTLPFCVHVSLKTEHLRPGVRAKVLYRFLVITWLMGALRRSGWMEIIFF